MTTDDHTLLWQQYSLDSVLQPIINLKDHEIIGVEALVRGVDGRGAICTPHTLFETAAQTGGILVLDRQCREAAFRSYQRIHGDAPAVLFVNITSSLLEDPSSSDDYLLEQVTRWNIDPGHVAIEVVESGIQSLSVLRRFVERYRAYGFLIALDDFGASHSNLERLVELKPDIVKIDRHLVSEVHTSHYKRSVVEAINGLCHSLGAISLAEGVEESQELECLSSLGCDLFQGYLLSRPLEDYDSSLTEVRKRVLRHASQTARHIADSARSVHDEITRIVETGRHLGRELQRLSRIDEQLSGLIRRLPDIQCAYVTDLHGMQITETVFNPSTGTREGVLFRPARRGADHSLKDYVYHIRSLGAPHFLTSAYLSRATGTLCRTVSVKTYTQEQTPVILCIDIVQA